MTKIVGIILLIHGVISIYRGIKGKSLMFVITPGDSWLGEKLFGEKGAKIFWNLFWGIIELIFATLILLGKFD